MHMIRGWVVKLVLLTRDIESVCKQFEAMETKPLTDVIEVIKSRNGKLLKRYPSG